MLRVMKKVSIFQCRLQPQKANFFSIFIFFTFYQMTNIFKFFKLNQLSFNIDQLRGQINNLSSSHFIIGLFKIIIWDMFIGNQFISKQNYKAMSLKLDSKDKRDKLRHFITNIQSHPSYMPFRESNHFKDYCFMDYTLISRNKRTLPELLKKLNSMERNTNIVISLQEVVDWMIEFFKSFQDYIFIDDPLYQECQKFIKRIEQFKDQFISCYNYDAQIQAKKVKEKYNEGNLNQKQKAEIPKNSKGYSSFQDKIQMVFFLKSHQNNQNFIRSLGQNHHIGRDFINENGKQCYEIRLDDQTSTGNWTTYIRKNQDQ